MILGLRGYAPRRSHGREPAAQRWPVAERLMAILRPPVYIEGRSRLHGEADADQRHRRTGLNPVGPGGAEGREFDMLTGIPTCCRR
jgi:hypothetical protein